MPFNGIEQQKIILFLTIFNIVNIIYNIANYERIVTVSVAGGWIMDGRHMEVMSHMSW